MRAFIAIEIPDGIKQEMAKAQEQLKRSGASAGWTRPEGIHLTLQFLGEVPESKAGEIQDALRQAVEGKAGFRLEIGGAGVFPDAKRPRVVWMGVSGDLDRLQTLQTAIEEAMTGIGFAREDRRFTPHLTLGRIREIRSRDAWQKALDGIRDLRLGEFPVTGVSLMKSELRPSGAVYTEVARVELN
ncbi:MAG TPA: RNA 2',3'-cyclic phosphodiesterase [Nitrospirota bacterium]|nr:RNA 2',3'-cyclic phosphodiesterase [Nitrospirota bacterium]